LAARRFVAELLTSARFRMSSPAADNGFVHPEFCFVAGPGTKHSRLA
jgi:hypothetical protein